MKGMSFMTTNQCNKECEVYSRIVGYFRPVANWNKGKQQEFKDRKVYSIKEVENLRAAAAV